MYVFIQGEVVILFYKFLDEESKDGLQKNVLDISSEIEFPLSVLSFFHCRSSIVFVCYEVLFCFR